MRDYRLQSLLNWTRLKFTNKGYWGSWLNLYLWQWIRPYTSKQYLPYSQIYNLSDIACFRKNLHKLGQFDPIWFQRVFEPETKGVRAWEYGLLLKLLESTNLKGQTILDAGTGGSLLPNYLASLGARVISLDTQKPMEQRSTSPLVTHLVGDMARLPYPDGYFDIVTCVSAIEHVGSFEKTQTAFKELIRVTKKSGLFYLTTDVYLKCQTTDNWPLAPPDSIKDAYSEVSFRRIFGQYITWSKFKKMLLSSRKYSNYRGRFFTTIAVVIADSTKKPTFTKDRF